MQQQLRGEEGKNIFIRIKSLIISHKMIEPDNCVIVNMRVCSKLVDDLDYLKSISKLECFHCGMLR